MLYVASVKHKAEDPASAPESDPYTMVSVRGRIVEQTNRGAYEHIDKMAKKYLGAEKYPFRAPGEKRVLLKIRPESVHYLSP